MNIAKEFKEAATKAALRAVDVMTYPVRVVCHDMGDEYVTLRQLCSELLVPGVLASLVLGEAGCGRLLLTGQFTITKLDMVVPVAAYYVLAGVVGAMNDRNADFEPFSLYERHERRRFQKQRPPLMSFDS